jgi:ATP-dependent RNA helicase RhlE
MLAGAQTGTGKTAAFAMPLLQLIASRPRQDRRPRVLVLTPTRELAAQVNESMEVYGQFLSLKTAVVFGGVGIQPQISRLRAGVDILVATPGRLLDHVSQRTVDLSRIEILVLDEADRMLDMGFIHDIKKVLQLLPPSRQNLLFSATYSNEIRNLTRGLLRDPVMVDVAPRNATADRVVQSMYRVGAKVKREVLADLVREGDWRRVLVFTRTKHGANRVAEYLCKRDISAAAIHGNKSQTARTKALSEFKDGTLRVLVATDIASRGLDISGLPHVVNFEMPHVPEDYVHRIGRTARAGASGEAISLVSREEEPLLKAVERLIGSQLAVVGTREDHEESKESRDAAVQADEFIQSRRARPATPVRRPGPPAAPRSDERRSPAASPRRSNRSRSASFRPRAS